MALAHDIAVPAPRTGGDAVRPVRERIVEGAGRLITAVGWQQITMAKVAAEAGVSRQTVYNEVGSKAGLAEAMVVYELGKAMDLVNRAFDAAPDDLNEAVRGSVAAILTRSGDNLVLQAIATASAGADSAFLPLMTTHGQLLLDSAKAVVKIRLVDYRTTLDDEMLEAMLDAVIRLVISHMMQPGSSPDKVADALATFTSKVTQANLALES